MYLTCLQFAVYQLKCNLSAIASFKIIPKLFQSYSELPYCLLSIVKFVVGLSVASNPLKKGTSLDIVIYSSGDVPPERLH
jgi:hypothetical protein